MVQNWGDFESEKGGDLLRKAGSDSASIDVALIAKARRRTRYKPVKYASVYNPLIIKYARVSHFVIMERLY